MTPTADLMRLVEKAVHKHIGHRSYLARDIIAEIAAALSALGEARVGGECENCGGHGFVVGYHDPYNRGDVSSPFDMPCPDCATPAQPKASESAACEHANWRNGQDGYWCEDCDEFMKEYEPEPQPFTDHSKASEGKAGGEDRFGQLVVKLIHLPRYFNAMPETKWPGWVMEPHKDGEWVQFSAISAAILDTPAATLTAPGADK